MSQKKDKDMLDARAKRKEKLKEAIGVIRNTVGVSTWSIKVASKEREGLVCEVDPDWDYIVCGKKPEGKDGQD